MSDLMADMVTAQRIKSPIAHGAMAAAYDVALTCVVGRVLNPCTEFDPPGPPSG